MLRLSLELVFAILICHTLAEYLHSTESWP